jgi:hypothetical protein
MACGCEKSPSSSAKGTPPTVALRTTINTSFTLTPPAGMKLLEQTEKTITFVTSENGRVTKLPMLIATRSSKVFANDPKLLRAAAEQFIKDLPDTNVTTPFRSTPITIDGMPGYESFADVLFDGEPAVLLCSKVIASDGSYAIVAVMAKANEARDMQNMRDAHRSLVLKEPSTQGP